MEITGSDGAHRRFHRCDSSSSLRARDSAAAPLVWGADARIMRSTDARRASHGSFLAGTMDPLAFPTTGEWPARGHESSKAVRGCSWRGPAARTKCSVREMKCSPGQTKRSGPKTKHAARGTKVSAAHTRLPPWDGSCKSAKRDLPEGPDPLRFGGGGHFCRAGACFWRDGSSPSAAERCLSGI